MTDNNGAQKKDPFKDAITQQIVSEQLQDKQLQQLMALQQSVLGTTDQHNLEQTNTTATQHNRRFWLSAITACLLVVVSVLFVWQQQGLPTPDYSRDIAYEVVKNHLKLKPLDVQTQSIDEVKQFFTQLDFLPVNSDLLNSRFSLQETMMLGGRYCSIKGVTAAQLRYQQPESGLSTLYEVPYDADTFGTIPDSDKGENPTVLLVKGLKVSMWVEKGLLMVLVTAI